MTLDHSALWSMYASLEEVRGKIGHVLECAIQKRSSPGPTSLQSAVEAYQLAPISVFEEVGRRHPEGLGELTQRSGVRVRPLTALYSDYSAWAYTGRFG